MRLPWLSGLAVLAALAALAAPSTARACPFCAAQSTTFGEEFETMDVVVIARLVDAPGIPAAGGTSDAPKATFEIDEILKGDGHLKDVRTIEALYYGNASPGQEFLFMGIDPPALMWSTPLLISERARRYLGEIVQLPKEGPDRLRYFINHLEDADEMLARDTYDEFARSSYDTIKAIRDDLDHGKLVDWIQDTDIPATRRRLYFTLLGVRGTADDTHLLEQMMRSDDRQLKAGLDAMIGCYLTLLGEEGMSLVEELFLKNRDAEYADTYAAIVALRFHGTEDDVVPRPRILEALYHILDRPELADLVIPDLARWNDWSQVDRLVELFKTADEKSSWVRVPVVNYLRACPLPEASERLKELEQIDPEAVRRAQTFFPFGSAPATDDGRTSALPAAPPAPALVGLRDRISGPLAVAAPTGASSDRAAAQPLVADLSVNRWTLTVVPWIAGALLLVLSWRILGGPARGFRLR